MKIVLLVMAKNEAAVLGRLLDSAYAVGIRDFLLVDTGSTDGTLDAWEAWTDLAEGITAVSHADRWTDFGTNRTAALRFARNRRPDSYILFADADMTVAGEMPGELTADGYRLSLAYPGGIEVSNIFLTSSAAEWVYEGKTHEGMRCLEPRIVSIEPLTTLRLVEHADSTRRTSGAKYAEDAALLEMELAGDPRTIFYLARSYEDLAATNPQDPTSAIWRGKAIARYRERAARKDGYIDEAWYSLYRIGCLTGSLAELLAAWEMKPGRWEPVVEACRLLRGMGSYRAGYAIAVRAMEWDAIDTEGLFIRPSVWQWELNFERSILAFYVGLYYESVDACRHLLGCEIPDGVRAQVQANMEFPLRKIAEAGRVATS